MSATRTFHETLRPVIVLFHLFGIFPIEGVLRRPPEKWQFRWCTIQTIYSVLLLAIGLMMCYVQYDRLKIVGVNADNVLGPLFFADTVMITILMVQLARRWSPVVGQWQHLDHHRHQTGFADISVRMGRKIRVVAVFLLIFGLAEHSFNLAKELYQKGQEALHCGWTYNSILEYQARRSWTFIFKRVPYHFTIFFALEYVITALTLAWAAQDIVIIVVSISLAGYFEDINHSIHIYGSGITIGSDAFWSEIRSEYVLVWELLENVNAVISPLILSSCCTNLYLVCYHLLNITRDDGHLTTTLYTYFSFAYMLVKTVMMLYYSSKVHEAARQPLKICRNVPSIGWGNELQRFCDMIRKNSIALNGMGFFQLTRKTMLSMVGTIITYELVMIKFSQTTAHKGHAPACSSLAFSLDE